MDTQTGRQAYRRTEGQGGRQTSRETDKQAGRQAAPGCKVHTKGAADVRQKVERHSLSYVICIECAGHMYMPAYKQPCIGVLNVVQWTVLMTCWLQTCSGPGWLPPSTAIEISKRSRRQNSSLSLLTSSSLDNQPLKCSTHLSAPLQRDFKVQYR